MSKERYNQIIDEVYNKYADSHFIPPSNPKSDFLTGQLFSVIPMEHSKESFINEIKNNPKFSKKWGLNIKERELSRKDRNTYVFENIQMVSNMFNGFFASDVNMMNDNDFNFIFTIIPTKLITLTYNNKTIEIYE